MKGLCAFAVVAVTLLLAACGGGGGSEARRDRIVEAMEDVDSFRAVFTHGDSSLTIEILEPDSFRVIAAGTLAGSEGPTQMESLYIRDRMYSRTCDGSGASCEEWEAREGGGAAGLGSYDPRWAIVALEMADEVSVSNDVLRGSVNQIRAVFEHSRRLQEGANVTPRFTRSCHGAETPVEIRDGTPVSTPRRSYEDDLECRDLSYEESLESQEPGLSFIDEHPSRIEAEFDPATNRLSTFTITMIEEDYEGGGDPEPSGETSTITFSYSKYNDITIEAPE
jgi:hypothetical protein